MTWIALLPRWQRVEIGELDLVDLHSIDAFAARWMGRRRPLHTLINGPGIWADQSGTRAATRRNSRPTISVTSS